MSNPRENKIGGVARVIDSGFLLLSIGLMLWAAFERFGRSTPEVRSSGFLLLTIGMTLMTAAPFLKVRLFRYSAQAMALCFLFASYLARGT